MGSTAITAVVQSASILIAAFAGNLVRPFIGMNFALQLLAVVGMMLILAPSLYVLHRAEAWFEEA